MNQEALENIFEPIINQFAWGVVQGHGSFLSFEFGSPKIDVSKAIKPQIDRKFPFNKFDSRHVYIKGEQTFFGYMSNWKIYAENDELAFDESDRDKILFALDFINGQKLLNIEIDPTQNITVLKFDLGGMLKISNDTYNDDVYEMWHFYTSSDKVLTYRNDHKVAFQITESEPTEEEFNEIKEKITCPNNG